MPGLVTSLAHASAHGGGSVSFALGDNRAGPIKVSDFTWKPRISGQGMSRLNATGSWPSHLDPRELVIDVSGRIVSADPSDYWSTRTDLIESITPPGHAAAYCLVNLTDCDIPLSAQSGRSTEYRISWVAHFGYWRAVAGDAVVFY